MSKRCVCVGVVVVVVVVKEFYPGRCFFPTSERSPASLDGRPCKLLSDHWLIDAKAFGGAISETWRGNTLGGMEEGILQSFPIITAHGPSDCSGFANFATYYVCWSFGTPNFPEGFPKQWGMWYDSMFGCQQTDLFQDVLSFKYIRHVKGGCTESIPNSALVTVLLYHPMPIPWTKRALVQ